MSISIVCDTKLQEEVGEVAQILASFKCEPLVHKDTPQPVVRISGEEKSAGKKEEYYDGDYNANWKTKYNL